MARNNAVRYASGAVFNWVALGVGILVAFFLSPFVVHHLGNAAYGVWVMVVGMTSYMGLLDLGLRGAVTRFVARAHASGEHDNASATMSAALWLRLCIVAGVVLLSATLAAFAPSVLHFPPELDHAARLALMTTGLTLSTTLISGVFGGVLAALHRFDITASATVTQIVVRVIAVVTVLEHGYGINALALCELGAALVAALVQISQCFRVYPELRIIRAKPDRTIIGTLFKYSAFVMVIQISQQVIFYSDNLVVGGFVSASAVTLYAIGGTLIEYLRQIIAALTATFMPIASRFDAQSREGSMQQLLIQGTRAALFVSLPIAISLFFRGPTFIRLWMGEQYAVPSGHVMRILLIGVIFVLANGTSINIAYGTDRHRPVALWMTLEAVGNLSLSIFLVRRMGISGVAWGTIIPSLVINALLWPTYITRLVKMRTARYLLQAWFRPALAAVPFGLLCYWTNRYWHPHSLLVFFLQIAAILPVFVICFAALFAGDLRELWRTLRPTRSVDTSSEAALARNAN